MRYDDDSPTYRVHNPTSTNKSLEASCCKADKPPSSMVDDEGSKSSEESVYDGMQNLETTGSDKVGGDNSQDDTLTVRLIKNKVMGIWQKKKT